MRTYNKTREKVTLNRLNITLHPFTEGSVRYLECSALIENNTEIIF